MLPVPVRSPATSSECSITTDATRAAALRRVRYGALRPRARARREPARIPWVLLPAATGHHRPPNDALMLSLLPGRALIGGHGGTVPGPGGESASMGSTHRRPGSHAASKKGDRGSGEHRDGNQVDECGLVQAIVRCGDAADHAPECRLPGS